jgi:hypothetical protein
MRKLGLIVLATFSFLSVGCAVKLQPAVQGEWSNFHNDKDKITKDARTHQDTPPEAK